jgi:HlyD family secretion protein
MPIGKKLGVVAILGALVGGAVLIAHFALADPAPDLRFAAVQRGDLQAAVSATGTLQAVTTVSVGTQVSGQVSELLVDFNSEVKKGQLLARIDPTIAQQAVADAQANLERLRAQTNLAARDQGRNTALAAEGLLPQNMVEQGEAALRVARASEKSASIALSRAQQNLSFTSILAPIDGVVVERNVNLGQTVAASLQAPQLFLIANDLTQMQILALVGESDIEQIQQGQSVRFTVQALPGQTFVGTVQQVRLQSTTVDNVVSYTVVVTVENPERKLLPGMTARVDFMVRTAENVLKVANAALRFRPTEDLLQQLGPIPSPSPRREGGAAREQGSPPEGTGSPSAGAPDESRRGGRTGRGPGGGRGFEGAREGGGGPRRSFGTLYSLGPDGKLKVSRVRTGISDGVSTEIEGGGVTEGMQVIVGLASAAPAANTQRPPNPLGGGQGGQGGGRGRPGGGGGPF